jgi:hypothetical protein
VEAFSNFTHFMLAWVCPVVGAYALIFICNGRWNGWANAYDFSLAITSPWANGIAVPWLALLLSIGGWLIVPVVAGAVVGYAVNSSLDRRRAPVPDQVAGLGAGPPRPPVGDRVLRRGRRFELIPSLRDRSVTEYFELDDDFVRYFVGLHDGAWSVADDHFGRIVKTTLRDPEVVKPRDPQGIAIRLAVKASAMFLLGGKAADASEDSSGKVFKPSSGTCPECHKGDDTDGGHE